MSRYIDEFVRCRRAADMLALRLFPNAKEITESFAAYAAVREHLRLDFGDPSICMLAVGDGHVPRTAATFAMRSAWTCFSVDPAMRLAGWERKVDRLHAYRRRILSVGGWYPSTEHVRTYSRCVVMAVHSHASLKASVDAGLILAPRVSVVSIPCCVKNDVSRPDVCVEDPGITSPARDVYAWKDIRESC